MQRTLRLSLVLIVAASTAIGSTHARLLDTNSSMIRGHILTAINAGGPSVSSPNGDVYAPGMAFASGTSKAYINPNGASAAIGNATTWELPLFNSMEYTFKPDFDLAYTLPLAAPTTIVIEVELLFAELDRGIGPDQRLFDVFINGELALSSFDIYAAAGGRERAVRVSVFLSPAPTDVVVTFGKVARKNKPTIGGVVCYNVSSESSTTLQMTTSQLITTTTATLTSAPATTMSTTAEKTSDASVSTSSLTMALTTQPSSR